MLKKIKETDKKTCEKITIDIVQENEVKDADILVTNDISDDLFFNLAQPKFLLTTKDRNPQLFIDAYEKNYKIKNLTIFASRIKFLKSKPNLLITSQKNDFNKKYNNHAKIILMDDVIIWGSGNFGYNAKVEGYFIIKNKCLSNKIKSQLAGK